MTYFNSSVLEREKLVKQYEPLINKLTNQFVKKVKYDWNSIKSMAYEGFVIAMNTYDDTKSKMTFTQFAAFAMRNNILTSLDNELRTVKMSNYNQKQAEKNGDAVFNTISIDININSNDDSKRTPQDVKLGMYEDEKFSNGNPLDYLCMRLDNQFDKRSCEMFYMTFGLKDKEETKGKDIAKYFNVSEGRVSQLVKKILKYIRQDENLCEVLSSMMK